MYLKPFGNFVLLATENLISLSKRIPDCGCLLSRFSDDSIYCHISRNIRVAIPVEPLITRVLQHTRSFLMVVISSYQQSTMVRHCDTIATS